MHMYCKHADITSERNVQGTDITLLSACIHRECIQAEKLENVEERRSFIGKTAVWKVEFH